MVIVCGQLPKKFNFDFHKIFILCLCGIISIRGHVFTILSQRGESFVTVLEVLREFIDQITEDVKERDRLNELYVQLNHIV